MAKQLLLIFVLLLLILSSVKSLFEDIIFTGFSHAGNIISLDGSAEIQENGILQLTNDTLRVMGHAFYSHPIQFKNSSDGQAFSFSSAFAFSIVPQYPTLGGHGLAFTISSTKDLHKALPSQYLGLLNASDVGNFSNHILAVEFDTVQDFEFGDIDDNHVGIDINSLTSNKSAPAAYFAENLTKQEINLKSGQTIQAWIDYDSLEHQLSVKLSTSSVKPNSSLLSLDVDLSATVRDTMYVGFSASTGLLASSHYIMGWSFKINGEARSLDISQLPSLPAPEKSHAALILGVCIAATLLTFSAIAFAFYMIRKIRNGDVIEEWEFNVGPHRYSYNELKQATKGFKDKNVLGFGGFGKVYEGTLPNSDIQVAVKRISHESKQGLREFLSEVSSVGRLRHKNLVQLLGWCRKKGDLLLVYDFMPNGSLDKYLFDNPREVLTWEERMKIIKGVASGLLYLHEEWEQAVIHRDIKAGNVLLDSEMNGRLGDFGLARLYEHGSNPNTTKVVGTLGYLAPELTKTGKPTRSSDVFAFGALLLEVVCGRRPVESKALPEELILLDWIWDKWRDGAILDVVDKKLNGQYDAVEAVLVLRLGLMCSSDSAEARLTMRQVVRYLEGEAVMPDEVVVPKGCDGEKDRALEDCLHSYRVSTESCSFTEGIDVGIVDLEACSASSSSPGVEGNDTSY